MTTLVAPRLTNSALVGSVEPRLWTRPLRPLTPETSYGFDVIDFARDVLGMRLFPWQEWLLIHACELMPNGVPRFRKVLVIIARQNGKTEMPVILSLFWLFVELTPYILGTSTDLETAMESWEKAVSRAEDTPDLARSIAPNGVRRANGQQTLTTVDRCRYKIAASNRHGGRGKTASRLILDELREHKNWSAYDAAVPATTTVVDAQVWMLSNAGDDHSIVLNTLRDQAIEGADERLGIFEWSAPGDDPTDIDNLLAANPSIGHNIDLEVLLGDAKRAKAAGGEQLTGFVTEHLCRRVALLNPAIDLDAWEECRVDGDLTALRENVAICLDVSMDERHATVYAAAKDGDKVRIDAVAAWEGPQAVGAMCSELPAIVERVKPKAIGWFPNGPAASAAAALAETADWPPVGVKLEALRAVTAVCMGFAEQVRDRLIERGDDPLLDAHVRGAEKLAQGDGWRFTRKGAGHVDAAYAAAGAVHLARTLPDDTVGAFFV